MNLLQDMINVEAVMLLHLLFALIAFKDVAGGNQRCYVCVPTAVWSAHDMSHFLPGPSLPTCSGFSVTKGEYIRECPQSLDKGCLTQTEGVEVTKTCSSLDVEDCQTANKVRYCYCKGDLCNDEMEPLPTDLEDEEDEPQPESALEGSGFSLETSDGQAKTTIDHNERFITSPESASLTTEAPNRDAGDAIRPHTCFPLLPFHYAAYLWFFRF